MEKSEKGLPEKEQGLKRPVEIRGKAESYLFIDKNFDHKFEFGFKNFATDELVELHVLLLIDSCARTLVDGMDYVIQNGSAEEIKVMMRDEQLYKALKLVRAAIKTRKDQFLIAAGIAANKKTFQGKAVKLYSLTEEEKRTYGRKNEK